MGSEDMGLEKKTDKIMEEEEEEEEERKMWWENEMK